MRVLTMLIRASASHSVRRSAFDHGALHCIGSNLPVALEYSSCSCLKCHSGEGLGALPMADGSVWASKLFSTFTHREELNYRKLEAPKINQLVVIMIIVLFSESIV